MSRVRSIRGRFKAVVSKWGWVFVLTGMLGASGVLCGCATEDPDNVSARPWNQPKNWETGLPPGMTERR
jgi:hypothetical protein